MFPFAKFPGVDTILGPEMRSTGEVMGIGATFPEAFDKAMLASGMRLPEQRHACSSACATRTRPSPSRSRGSWSSSASAWSRPTARRARCRRAGVPCERVNKVHEGSPHMRRHAQRGEIDIVINTTSDAKAIRDSYSIRRQTLMSGVPYFTTMAAASAATGAIESSLKRGARFSVRSLQEYHG